MPESCQACGAAPPQVTLKRCAKCSSTPYCSRDCQKADWRSHKKTCGKQGPSSPSSLSHPLTQPITTPFTLLDNGTYLHGLPPQDVYTLLIDAHRLRVSDAALFEGASQSTAITLPDFLAKAEAAGNLLPAWWTPAHAASCAQLAQGGGGGGGGGVEGVPGMAEAQRAWLDMRAAPSVDKAAVTERYGSPQMPMQLRMLAEAVHGRGVGGQSGASMRKMMASMEGGKGEMMGSLVDAMTGRASRIN